MAYSCPIKLSQIIQAVIDGSFRPLNEDEKFGYDGIEGEGSLWAPSDDIVVLMDKNGDTIAFEVYKTSIGLEDGADFEGTVAWRLSDGSFQEIG